jgi:hypothetical protein
MQLGVVVGGSDVQELIAVFDWEPVFELVAGTDVFAGVIVDLFFEFYVAEGGGDAVDLPGQVVVVAEVRTEDAAGVRVQAGPAVAVHRVWGEHIRTILLY